MGFTIVVHQYCCIPILMFAYSTILPLWWIFTILMGILIFLSFLGWLYLLDHPPVNIEKEVENPPWMCKEYMDPRSLSSGIHGFSTCFFMITPGWGTSTQLCLLPIGKSILWKKRLINEESHHRSCRNTQDLRWPSIISIIDQVQILKLYAFV